MRIKDLGDMFPKNDIRAKCYQMTNADKIAEQYKIIEDAYTDIKDKASSAVYILPKIIRARQAVELLKVPTFIQLIKENIADGKSSVVFLNFNETLKTIADELDIDCVVHGEQSIEERNQNIRDFQANKKTIILLNIKAGSAGISLHDLLGSHQRVSIISPTWSAQDFIQSLGRIHRAGGKTDAIQKVVFCEGTIEEFICDTLKYKLEHLSKFNDGDFDTYKIEGISTKASDSNQNSDDESDDESPQEALLGDDYKKSQQSQTTKSLFNPMSKGKKKTDKEIDL
jgi:superfamily II DNA or RNA helicase